MVGRNLDVDLDPLSVADDGSDLVGPDNGGVRSVGEAPAVDGDRGDASRSQAGPQVGVAPRVPGAKTLTEITMAARAVARWTSVRPLGTKRWCAGGSSLVTRATEHAVR